MDWFFERGIRILIIIGVALVIYLLLRLIIPFLVKRYVTRRMAGQFGDAIEKRSKTLSAILVTLSGVTLAVIAILTILPEFGVNVTTLIAGLGIGGLAVAFAAQNLVRDIITGFFILLEDQYRIGDVVNIAGIGGLVEDMGLRRTMLRDLDGIVHSVPNGKVEVASNYTKGFSRVNLNISVGYGEDLYRCIDTLNKICAEMADDPKWKEDFLTMPKVLRVDGLGDSGIVIKILGDTKPMRQWDVTGELRLRIKETFDKEGIEIPWPHTKIYFGNSPSQISTN